MNGPTTSQTPPGLDTNTPIANIPDDVLFDIVHLVIEMSDHLTQRLLRTQRSWLSITQVCAYWRSLITNNPAFWTNLKLGAFFNRQLAAAFLRRANGRLFLGIGAAGILQFATRCSLPASSILTLVGLKGHASFISANWRPKSWCRDCAHRR